MKTNQRKNTRGGVSEKHIFEQGKTVRDMGRNLYRPLFRKGPRFIISKIKERANEKNGNGNN